jgi:exopolysaccharide biosynthesis polyprenyl glycosylphosphotransferase
MAQTSKALALRVHACINAAVAALMLLGVFIVANWERMPEGMGAFLAMRVTIKNLGLFLLFGFGWALSFRVFGLAIPQPGFSLGRELIQISKACLTASAFALLFALTSQSGAFGLEVVAYFFPVAVLSCMCGRIVARVFADRVADALRGTRNVIIVGSGPRASAVYERLQAPNNSLTRVLGFVDSVDGRAVPTQICSRMLGDLDDLESILMNTAVDEVVIALPAKSCYEQIQTAIQTCERVGVEAKYLRDLFQLSLAKPKVEPDDAGPVVSLKVVQDDYRLVVKRCIDVLASSACLLLLSPVMALIAIAIKLTSPGPVIFAQERFGWRKRRFRMFKFRTMVADAEMLQAGLESRNEVHGPIFKIRRDPRVTPVGRILRKTSLDELPQFVNVLLGDMALVGPRPLPERDVSRFDNAALMRRFSVKPGLTCLWQVTGRSDIGFERWIELDLRYIDTWSLSLDFRILAQTIPAVLKGTGAV